MQKKTHQVHIPNPSVKLRFYLAVACLKFQLIHHISAKLADEHAKLLRVQKDMGERMQTTLLDLPLRDTIIHLIAKQDMAKADMLRKEHRVQDKQYWWWKIDAMAQQGMWNEMEAFGKAKKSPIGYLVRDWVVLSI